MSSNRRCRLRLRLFRCQHEERAEISPVRHSFMNLARSTYFVNEIESHGTLAYAHFFAFPIHLIVFANLVDDPMELSRFLVLLPITFTLIGQRDERERERFQQGETRRDRKSVV